MSANFNSKSKHTKYLFVDASYFIFFRYHALKNWWKLAKKDESQECSATNAAFVAKFKELFVSKFKEIFKKLKLDPKETKVFVGKDCFQHEIWRNQHTTGYKDGRVENNEIGAFFKMIYADRMFTTIPGIDVTLLEYPSLEADDCIALAVKKLYANDVANDNIVSRKYFIITSDHDYGQLLSPDASIVLYNLKYKDLCDGKKVFEDGKKNLFVKVCSGDKSDNIPSIFPKCGFVTACKMYEDAELLMKKTADPTSKIQMAKNNLIINFDCIPQDLQRGFYEMYPMF